MMTTPFPQKARALAAAASAVPAAALALAFAAAGAAVPAAAAPATDAETERLRAAFAEQTRDGILANVNGNIVTVGDLRRETLRYIPELRRNSSSADEFRQRVNELASSAVRSLADTYLLAGAFDDAGAMIDENFIDQRINEIIEQDFDGDRAKYLQMLRRTGSNPLADRRRMTERIKASSWDEHIVSSAYGDVSPKKVREAYEAQIDAFRSEAAVEYAQIVLFAGASETDAQVGELAADIRRRILAGEIDFETAAKRYSRDDYRTAGGYVGWKPLADLAERIVPALRDAKDGAVSDVVALESGNGVVYVLLKRIAFREAGVIPLKDVRLQIENRLRNEHIRRVREEKMAELRDEYFIRYY